MFHVLLLVSLEDTTTGDDTIREILGHLQDLTHYSGHLSFDTSLIARLMQMGSVDMCTCKELIATELLKTFALVKINNGDVTLELHTTFRMLQYNIKALLQQSWTETVDLKCPEVRTEVVAQEFLTQEVPTQAEQKAPQLFVEWCVGFFQRWMSRCLSSSDSD